jgi:hypothetical protein
MNPRGAGRQAEPVGQAILSPAIGSVTPVTAGDKIACPT